MRYELLDAEGKVINTIIATKEFVDEHYPEKYREIEDISMAFMPEPISEIAELSKKIDVLIKKIDVLVVKEPLI